MLLDKEIEELERSIDHSEKLNTSISKSGVDWHVDHSLRVIIGVCKSLKNSKPEEYLWTFNWKRSYIFLIGYIPRGVARAPKSVVVSGEITENNLRKMLAVAKAELKKIDSLPEKAHFDHPYFGLLPLKKTIRFLRIHTRHHLKIIHDIIAV